MFVFNHEKLAKRINATFGSKEAFGKELGLDKQKINSRLCGVTEFTQSEIEQSVDLLDLLPEQIPAYFFEAEVCRV